MKAWQTPLVLALGLILAVIGFWWLWTGLDIVQVERGWSAVIAGATMLSAGLVIAAMAAILARLGDIAAALRSSQQFLPQALPIADVLQPAQDEPETLSPPAAEDLPSERQVVGRHVSGDATYIMFADGTVEAQTGDETLRFASLEELRAYADEREAAAGKA